MIHYLCQDGPTYLCTNTAGDHTPMAHRPSTWVLYDHKWEPLVRIGLRTPQQPRLISLQSIPYTLVPNNTWWVAPLLKFSVCSYGRSQYDLDTRTANFITLLSAWGSESQILAPHAWDLNVLLWCLHGPPFEPLHTTSFFNLTKKTIFLFALATAASVGKLHARNISRVCFDNNLILTQWELITPMRFGRLVYTVIGLLEPSWKGVFWVLGLRQPQP